jgi:hypothetical protein
MKELILSEENLKELDGFIQEMPTKYGLPLLKIFQKIAEEQNLPTEEIPTNSEE